MAVMTLVLETKMADVGKLISLGNLLVRNVTWLVLTTTSATLIMSRDFGADCMTRIVNIYSRLSRTHSFPFWLTETTRSLTLWLTETIHSFHFDFQRQHTLSLSYIWLPAINPRNVYSLQLFSSLFYLYVKTCSSLENNHRNFVKPPKETNNQHGRRHVPPDIHN